MGGWSEDLIFGKNISMNPINNAAITTDSMIKDSMMSS